MSPHEFIRYSRQMLLPGFGKEGQERIKAASVLCVGVGGLGSAVATYLAAAGVGRLGLVDDGVVEISNLHRQPVYSTKEAGRWKTESARKYLRELNPYPDIAAYSERMSTANADHLIGEYDLVVDCTDNLPARYLVNDACVLSGKPEVYGAAYRFDGRVSVFSPASGGPCYRCLYPKPPAPDAVPGCLEDGVLGMVPGLIGCIQAAEALKLIVAQGENLLGWMLVVDALGMNFRKIRVKSDPSCPLCGQNPRIRKLEEIQDYCSPVETADDNDRAEDEITVNELKREMDKVDFSARILDVREPFEYEIAHLDGALLIPFGLLRKRYSELDPEQTLFVYCQTGDRSRWATDFLKERGFKDVRNVQGGLEAWAEKIDPDFMNA
ncbi:MAG: molybdopterin-synthase adenylyltransferase MoeB [Verrucomicrobia bacterium]|nr:molybdopterin-synthase adenylyltransferase MoeB [Verrucomicrobiota bacterium]